MNALTEPMGDALTEVVTTLKDDTTVRAAVLTGAGKAFSAGGDLEWLLARHRNHHVSFCLINLIHDEFGFDLFKFINFQKLTG